MNPFEYFRPTTLPEACEAASGSGAVARLLSGGTDLTIALRQGHSVAGLVIDLKAVAEMKADIALDGGALRISAGTTMMQLGRYLGDQGLLPALQEAADVVGSIQIRNRATLAGNICNASPAADTVPVLAVLGAEVELHGPNGTRRRPVAEFIEGNRQIDRAAGEIVTAIHIPLSDSPSGIAFDRITRRRGVDLATTNMACTVTATGDVVVAFGSVSPRPLVLRDETGILGDPKAASGDRMQAIKRLAAQATPISDVRANADYRTAMLEVMMQRSLVTAQARLTEPRNA